MKNKIEPFSTIDIEMYEKFYEERKEELNRLYNQVKHTYVSAWLETQQQLLDRYTGTAIHHIPWYQRMVHNDTTRIEQGGLEQLTFKELQEHDPVLFKKIVGHTAYLMYCNPKKDWRVANL